LLLVNCQDTTDSWYMIHVKHSTELFILLTLFTIPSLYAEAIKLNQSQFWESYSQSVNISGSVRAGVMYDSPADHVIPDLLYLDISTKSDQLLCVSMVSVDGQYGAKFTYQLSDKIHGLTPFQLPTKLREVMIAYTPEQIAVLSEIKPVCKGKSGHIIPASWGKPSVNTVKVYLNSGISRTTLKLYKFSGGKIKLKCLPMQSDKNNTAYDTECIITNAGDYDLSKTKILRSNFGNHSRPIKLNIYN
jgi:hypothetical protein